jgi:hypothetical protein
MKRFRPRLTYANVVATIALFIALGGASYAAIKLPKNSVKAPQIAPNAVGSSELRNHSAVQPADVSQALATRLQQAIGAPGGIFIPPRSESACAVYAPKDATCVNVRSGEYRLGFLHSHTSKLSCPSGYEFIAEEEPAGPEAMIVREIAYVVNTDSPHYSGADLEFFGKTSGSFTFTNWDTHTKSFQAVTACGPK